MANGWKVVPVHKRVGAFARGAIRLGRRVGVTTKGRYVKPRTVSRFRKGAQRLLLPQSSAANRQVRKIPK